MTEEDGTVTVVHQVQFFGTDDRRQRSAGMSDEDRRLLFVASFDRRADGPADADGPAGGAGGPTSAAGGGGGPLDDGDVPVGRLPFRWVTETTTIVEGREVMRYQCSCHYQTAMMLPCRHVLYLMVRYGCSAFEILLHCGRRWWRADRAHVLADIAKNDNAGPVSVMTILSTSALRRTRRAILSTEETFSTSSRSVSEGYSGMRRREHSQTLMSSINAALAHESVDSFTYAQVSYHFFLRRQVPKDRVKVF